MPACGCGHIATQQAGISIDPLGRLMPASRYTDSAHFGSNAVVGPLFFSNGSGQGQGYLARLQDQLPIVSLLSTHVSGPGSQVTVSGERLGSATRVTVNGRQAPFAVQSANQLLVTVPSTWRPLPVRLTARWTSTSPPQRQQRRPWPYPPP